MEELGLMRKANAFADKKIVITGHTGFKGTWLSQMLRPLQCEIIGISLPPEENSLYSQISNNGLLREYFLNIQDRESFVSVLQKEDPDIIFHLAAQPIVLKAYADPIETMDTNVLGTINLLSAIPDLVKLKGIIVVTTDKVYRNEEKKNSFNESDPLGGKDPYSASKASVEIILDAWRHLPIISARKLKLVSVRSGNVIGGGDRAENRLIPDLVKGSLVGQQIGIRNPNSIRPWQHVLDTNDGYIKVASQILQDSEISQTFNFGPSESSKLTVSEMASIFASLWGSNCSYSNSNSESELEMKHLWLDSSRARSELGWNNKLDARESIKWVVNMERSKQEIQEIMSRQIQEYGEK
jgi:CDP-glucose 4,6-dehydratase